MQCAFILAITVARDNSDRELIASHSAMAKKYGARQGVTLVNLLLYRHQTTGVDTFLAAIEQDLPPLVGKTVGLYWGLHYVTAERDTEQPVEMLAELTAELLRMDIKFKKINLGTCYGAGIAPRGGSDVGIAFEDSVVKRYCTKLSGTLGEQANLLDNCMVAGYRTEVIMYAPNEPFFTEKNASYIRNIDPQRPQNTFSQGGGSLSETHPHRNPQQAPYGFDIKKTYVSANKKHFAKHDQSSGPFSIPVDSLLPPMQVALYRKIMFYLQTKRVLKFTQNAWVNAGLAEYTDSLNVQNMIAAVRQLEQSVAGEAGIAVNIVV